jgi:hypothetical protein
MITTSTIKLMNQHYNTKKLNQKQNKERIVCEKSSFGLLPQKKSEKGLTPTFGHSFFLTLRPRQPLFFPSFSFLFLPFPQNA